MAAKNLALEKEKKFVSHKQQIEALTKISEVITSDLYLEDVLKLIVTVTAEVMNSKICSLMLIDEEKQKLSIRATQSVSEEYNRKPSLKVGEGIAGKVAEENRPVVVDDVTQEREYKYRDIAEKEGLCSLLSVPMSVRRKVIGVINSYTSKPRKFNKSEIDVLTTVANQAAIVIENAELMVKTKVIQEELETRKAVERAKGILMKEQGLSEEKAFRRIQKYSMDSRKSMREIAEAIVLASEVRR